MSETTALPTAEDTIALGSRDVLRFHPTHKKIKDKVPRCISCGQIDEVGYHDERWCPGMGGYLPFATSLLKANLKADSGYRAEVTTRLSIQQWALINAVMAAGPGLTPACVDQVRILLADMPKGDRADG